MQPLSVQSLWSSLDKSSRATVYLLCEVSWMAFLCQQLKGLIVKLLKAEVKHQLGAASLKLSSAWVDMMLLWGSEESCRHVKGTSGFGFSYCPGKLWAGLVGYPFSSPKGNFRPCCLMLFCYSLDLILEEPDLFGSVSSSSVYFKRAVNFHREKSMLKRGGKLKWPTWFMIRSPLESSLVLVTAAVDLNEPCFI